MPQRLPALPVRLWERVLACAGPDLADPFHDPLARASPPDSGPEACAASAASGPPPSLAHGGLATDPKPFWRGRAGHAGEDDFYATLAELYAMPQAPIDVSLRAAGVGAPSAFKLLLRFFAELVSCVAWAWAWAWAWAVG